MQSVKQKRIQKKAQNLSPTRKSKSVGTEVKSVPQTKGGPKLSFLERYKLDEKIHPTNCLNVLLPLVTRDNLELMEDVDMKGDLMK